MMIAWPFSGNGTLRKIDERSSSLAVFSHKPLHGVPDYIDRQPGYVISIPENIFTGNPVRRIRMMLALEQNNRRLAERRCSMRDTGIRGEDHVRRSNERERFTKLWSLH